MADADAAPDSTTPGDAAATAATTNAGNSGFDAGYVDDLGDSQFQGYFANVELDANPPSQRMGMRTGSFDRLASMIDHVKSGDNEFVHRSVETVDRLVNQSKQKVAGTIRKVGRLTAERRAKVAKRMRRIITGDANKRVRDHLKEEMKKPVRVKMVDKLSFTGGVGFLLLCQYIFLMHTQHFTTFYMATMIPLLAIRFYLYKKLKFHFFLIDYCYSIHVATIFHILVCPDNKLVAQIIFAGANGPIVWAVVMWRNSLVFHSLDKTTSLLIHVFPPLVTYCMRWHPPTGSTFCLADDCSVGWVDVIGYPMLYYGVWQLLYVIFTEYIVNLDKDPSQHTSLRWFVSHPSGMTHAALKVARRIGFFGPKEELEGLTLKTKIVFVVSQFTYTLAALLPAKFLFESRLVHMWFLVIIFGICVWNGAGFYIEVFSVRYRQQIEAAIQEHERRSRAGSDASASSEGAASGTTEHEGDTSVKQAAEALADHVAEELHLAHQLAGTEEGDEPSPAQLRRRVVATGTVGE